MIALSGLAFLLPALGFFALVRRLTSPAGHARALLPVQITVATGAALGLASCGFFAWRVLVGVPGAAYFVVEAAVSILLMAICLWYRPPRRSTDRPLAQLSQAPPLLLTLAFACAAGAAAAAFVLQSAAHPHGQWDAWSIWNLRGRILLGPAGSGDLARALNTPSGSDYPLLLPSLLARAWLYLGSQVQAVPAFLGLLFTAGTVALMVGSLSLLRGSTQALIAGVLLASTQSFLVFGAAQYADVPLAFFILSALVLLELHDTLFQGRSGLLGLAGMMAGLAAWTKNDGALFALVFLTVRAVIVAWNQGVTVLRRQMLSVAMGLAPVLLVVLWFKVRIATPDPLVANQGLHQTLQRMADVGRYPVIASAFGKGIIQYGDWAAVNLVPMIVFWLLFVGIDVRSASTPSRLGAAITLVAVAAGYAFVYVITPYDLAWHVGTSLPRLLTQLWPSVLWTALLVARPWPTAVEGQTPPAAP